MKKYHCLENRLFFCICHGMKSICECLKPVVKVTFQVSILGKVQTNFLRFIFCTIIYCHKIIESCGHYSHKPYLQRVLSPHAPFDVPLHYTYDTTPFLELCYHQRDCKLIPCRNANIIHLVILLFMKLKATIIV